MACTPMQDENGQHDDYSCRSTKIRRPYGGRINNLFDCGLFQVRLFQVYFVIFVLLTICVEN